MANVSCTRCGSTAEGLGQPPLPGEVGDALVAHTCAACWRAWLDAQVILINERSLSPGRPADYDLLVGEMRVFLNLPSAE